METRINNVAATPAAGHARLAHDTCCLIGLFPLVSCHCVRLARNKYDCSLSILAMENLCPSVFQKSPFSDYWCILGAFPFVALFCGPDGRDDNGLYPGCSLCCCLTVTAHKCNAREGVVMI